MKQKGQINTNLTDDICFLKVLNMGNSFNDNIYVLAGNYSLNVFKGESDVAFHVQDEIIRDIGC